jgi:hypothetical protein
LTTAKNKRLAACGWNSSDSNIMRASPLSVLRIPHLPRYVGSTRKPKQTGW